MREKKILIPSSSIAHRTYTRVCSILFSMFMVNGSEQAEGIPCCFNDDIGTTVEDLNCLHRQNSSFTLFVYPESIPSRIVSVVLVSIPSKCK